MSSTLMPNEKCRGLWSPRRREAAAIKRIEFLHGKLILRERDFSNLFSPFYYFRTFCFIRFSFYEMALLAKPLIHIQV